MGNLSSLSKISSKNTTPARITIAYFIVSTLWILFSDLIAHRIVTEPETLLIVSMTKGWLFIIVTALLIFYLIRREISRIEALNSDLLESNKMFSVFADTTHENVWTADLEGRFTFANNATCETYGLGPEEMLGKSLAGFTVPGSSEDSDKVLTSILREGQISSFEHNVLNSSGSVSTLLTNAVLLRDSKNEPSLIMGTSLDITERKKAEEALRRSELKYHAIFEGTGTSTMIVEEDTTISLANNECRRLTGYSPSELIGRKWTEFTAPESLEEMMINHHLRRSDPAAAPAKYEVKLINKNGETRNAIIDIEVIPETRQSIVSILDITELKQAGEALRLNEEKYRKLVDASQGLIWRMNEEGRFTYISNSAKDYYGIDAENMIGRCAFDFHEPGSVEGAKANLKRIFETGEVNEVLQEDVINRPDGKVVYLVERSVAVKNSEGKVTGLMGTSLDITERKLAENAMRAYSQQIGLLYDAAQKLNLTLDIGQICRTIFESLKKLVPADSLVLSSYDEVKKLITIRGYWIENTEISTANIPPIPLGEGVQSTVIRSGESEVVNDYQQRIKQNQNTYYVQETGELTEVEPDESSTIKSAIVIPLKVKGKITGVLQIFNLKGYSFNEEQLRIVESLSHYVSVAQQNAILYDEINKELNERIQAEEALVKSEEKYRKIVETANEGIMQVSRDRKISFANRKLETFLGYGEGELLGKPVLELFPQNEIDAVNRRFEQRKAGTSSQFERTFKRKNGELIWAFVSSGPITDEDGRYAGSLAMITDVSEWKMAQQALKESESRYRTLVEMAPFGIRLSDLDANCVFANKAAYTMHGFQSDSEIIGKPLTELVYPEDRPRALDNIKQIVNHEIVSNREMKYLRADGSYFEGELNATLLRDSKGEPTGILSIVQDITERKIAEKKIRESEERYRKIVETANEGIWMVDDDAVTVFANSKIASILGYELHEMMGRRLFDFMTLSDREIVKHNLEKRKKGISDSFEFKFIKKDGSLTWTFVSVNPIFDIDGKYQGSLSMVTDINEWKKAQMALAESENRYRTLVETAPFGIRMFDMENNLIFANSATLSLHGYDSFDELKGVNLFDLVAPEAREEAGRSYFEVIRTGSVRNRASEYLRKDGSRFDGEFSAALIYDKERNPRGIISVLQDVSERKRIEAQIEQSELYYRTLTNTLPLGIVMLDLMGEVTYYSEQIRQMFRFPEGMNGIGEKYIDRLVPVHREAAKERMLNVITTKDFTNAMFDYELLRFDGSTFWANTNTAPHVDVNGELSGVLVVVQDITEKRRIQEELFENKEQLSAVLSAAMDTIIVTDENLQIVFFNSAAESLLKCSYAYALGKNIDEFIPKILVETDLKKSGLSKKIGDEASGLHYSFEWVVCAMDGTEVPVEASFSSAEIKSKRFYTVILRNIADRLKYENELKKANNDLRSLAAHLQKIREEERMLIARDIHDQLGQDLTALKMDIVMLSKDIVKMEGFPDQNPVVGELHNMANLTDKTIKWVRKISTELRPDVLDRLGLFEAIEWHAGEFEKRTGIKCEIKLEGNDAVVNKDHAIVLFRILQESLTNVMRHSGAGKVKILFRNQKEKLIFSVEDNGKGFDSKSIDGNGSLGLIGMKERSFTLGGNVEINSVPGKGTLVKVTIPKTNTYANE